MHGRLGTVAGVCLFVCVFVGVWRGRNVCLSVRDFFFPFLRVTEYFLLRHFAHFVSQCVFVLSVRL